MYEYFSYAISTHRASCRRAHPTLHPSTDHENVAGFHFRRLFVYLLFLFFVLKINNWNYEYSANFSSPTPLAVTPTCGLAS